MSQRLQAVRGMNDIGPEHTSLWHAVESYLMHTAHQFGYKEIRFPVLEKTELFARSVGESTDIVEKEMYTFDDRNGDSLSLRPEGTACAVRAGLQRGWIHNQIQRFWYLGPMFRHERPQRGRLRQFHQFGLEFFGVASATADAELLQLTAAICERLGISHRVRLEINYLGHHETRARYREQLVAYFKAHQEQLDEDSERRLTKNPLRILDSKNPAMQALLDAAPKITDCMSEEEQQYFTTLKTHLEGVGIPFTENPRLVRGLDYYSGTVFEWITDELGAQGTICAGGRYDKLVENLGGHPAPAMGCALGIERLVELIGANYEQNDADCVYFIGIEAQATVQLALLAQQLRDQLGEYRIVMDCQGGSLKSQLKRADKLAAKWAVIMGEDEYKTGQVLIKPMQGQGEKQQINVAEVVGFFKESM